VKYGPAPEVLILYHDARILIVVLVLH
jgi:hypothetical protein